jgi:Kef-type K+ transport system membrane component KefB
MNVVFELVAGLVAGNLRLLGFSDLEFLKTSRLVDLLAQFALVLLFFRVGLEATVSEMKTVGAAAFMVAAFGIAGSFACGWAAAKLLLPGTALSGQIFIAASLTATSVGVTARVLKDLRQLRSRTAHVILGAAVVDDIVGLAVLAIVGLSGVLPVALNAGALLAVAAFVAGLVIDEHRSRAIDELIAPVASWIVPIFFVVIGMRADLSGLAKPGVVLLAAGLTVAAVLGKQFCAFGVPHAHASHVDRIAVGIGMVPRGEVTLIFATLGLSPEPFLAVVLTVIATTLLAPIGLKMRLARQ